MFLIHFDHLHTLFKILNYFSLVDIIKKKSNSMKYVFDTFKSVMYFLITFLIESMLMLFKKNKIQRK
jgi:hypothetical protein